MSAAFLHVDTGIHTPLLKSKDNAVFAAEAIDLFKHRRQGHLIHRMYMSEAALEYWSAFMKHSGYYVTRSEIGLISMFASVIGRLATHRDGIIGIENGPGTQSAIRKKSSVFFSAMPDLHTYIGRDWSPEVVKNIARHMPLDLFNTHIIADQANFLEKKIPDRLGKGRKVMAEFGITQGNMEGFPHSKFPKEKFLNDMVFHRSQLDAEDFYVVTFDANQNEKTITNAYTSEWLTQWGRELFRTMKTELAIKGDFDAEAFVFIPVWHPQSHVNTNNMVATRTMHFSINGVDLTAHKGEPFGITNSYKAPVELFSEIAEKASFERISCFQDAEKRMALAVFKAG